MKKKIEKKFLFFEINPSEFVALKCLYEEKKLASALSVLGKCFEIFHITNRDFL